MIEAPGDVFVVDDIFVSKYEKKVWVMQRSECLERRYFIDSDSYQMIMIQGKRRIHAIEIGLFGALI